MILFEYEGKQILFEDGIDVPHSQLIYSPDDEIMIKPPLLLKAQVLSGKRAEVGGIVAVDESADLKSEVDDLFNEIINKEKVDKILAEEKIEYEKSYYVSLAYDTEARMPVLTYSEEGGTGIEGKKVLKFPIDPINWSNNLPNILDSNILNKIVKAFFENDCLLLEINPLVKTSDGRFIALDSKIKLDDDAKFRHTEWQYPPRLVAGHTPTTREIEAKKIDEGDYRGTAGSAYFDLDGDIAILSSGGGISLTAMDAIIASGGKPANFTEYSGNPPKEKVTKLTEIVLSKPNLHGLWVIGTVAANFTDIFETLSGLIEGIREVENKMDTKFNFPIVIRRGGPREDEAKRMIEKIKDLNITFQGEEVSVSESAKVMVEEVRKYASA